MSSKPHRCKEVIELLGRDKNISWIRADYRSSVAVEKIEPNQFEATLELLSLPQRLKEKLSLTDTQGKLKNKMATILEVKRYLERRIKERIFNLTKAPEGLRQLDLWMHDKNGKDEGFAIRQLLKPDIGFFGVGHGAAGGEHHYLYPIMNGEKPLIQVSIEVDKIIELYSKLPGVKKSRAIFYKTCSGGLPSESGEADAVRLARATGVPVIAPMGILYNSSTIISGKSRHWDTHVENEATREVLNKNEAFRVFMPDGTSKPISFEKMKELIIREEFLSRVSYGRD